MITAMKFSEKLDLLAEKKHWGRPDLVQAIRDLGIAISDTTVDNYFNGKTKPDMEKALAIARALGVSLDYLADDSLDQPPAKEELTEDEKWILRMFRTTDLKAEEAVHRMLVKKHGVS